MRARRTLLAAALLALVGGCKSCNNDTGVQPKGNLAPLTSPPQVPLPVSGFGDAVVSVPIGATAAMPVVVAVLGIGDTPEEQCEAWRDIVGIRAFVLCPRGAKHYVQDDVDASADAPPVVPKQAPPPAPSSASSDDARDPETPAPPPPAPAPAPAPTPKPKSEPRQVGFFPVDVPTLDRELAFAIAALRQRFTKYVSDKSFVYAGFSRGAFLGASIVARHPDKFGRAILIEGGQSAWTPESAATFAKGGGKRVLFACGQPSCVEEVAPPSAILKNQKIDIRVVHGTGEGHGYKKQVKDEIKKSFDWVVEGDPLWPR